MTQIRVKPHKCNQCGYSSIKLANMRLHKMTHSGEKPNQCPQCDFSSITADHMTTHMRRSQTGEKPYKCEHCAHSFVSAGNLQRHKMSHNKEKTFLCYDCNKTFKHKFWRVWWKRTFSRFQRCPQVCIVSIFCQHF